MRQIVFISAILLFVGGLAIYMLSSRSDLTQDLLFPLSCDLNLNSCTVEKDGERVKFSISPLPIKPLKEFELKISGLKECKEYVVKARGLNMHMGVVQAPLEQIAKDECRAKMIVASCTEPVMRYRVELFKGKESSEIYADFDLVQR